MVDVVETYTASALSIVWGANITTNASSPAASPFTVPIQTMLKLDSDLASKADLFTTWTNGCVQNNGRHPGMCFSDWNGPSTWGNALRTVPFHTAPGWRYGAGKGGQSDNSVKTLPTICSRTLMGCFATSF